MKMLEVNDLTTEFSTENGTVKAVRDVSFYVDKGEVLGVVGESGSGKSQTMFSIMGLLAGNGSVTNGSIKIDGEEIAPTHFDSRKKYEETIKLDEEKLRAKVPKIKSFWSVYEYLKVSPVTSIPITAEYLNLSYNSVSKAFATLQKYNIIMQRNNSTRNRIWEYTCLDFIFTLPSNM